MRLVGALVVTTGIAGVLALLDVSRFATAWGLSAVVIGALVGLTAGDQVTRGVNIDLGTVFGVYVEPSLFSSRARVLPHVFEIA